MLQSQAKSARGSLHVEVSHLCRLGFAWPLLVVATLVRCKLSSSRGPLIAINCRVACVGVQLCRWAMWRQPRPDLEVWAKVSIGQEAYEAMFLSEFRELIWYAKTRIGPSTALHIKLAGMPPSPKVSQLESFLLESVPWSLRWWDSPKDVSAKTGGFAEDRIQNRRSTGDGFASRICASFQK